MAAMEVVWDQISERDWTRHARAPLQQSWAYGAACAALGSRVLRAEVWSGGRRIALAQAVHRSFFGYLHAAVCTRGPIWVGDTTGEERRDAFRAITRSLPLPWTRGFFVTPDAPENEATHLRRARLRRVMTPYTTAVLDLAEPTDRLRAALHQKWRNRLVAAEKAGLMITRADRRPERYLWLLEQEAKQQRARRYAALPPALVPAWQQAGGDLRVLTATQGSETIAAMLFLIHGDRATYHIGWSSEAGKKSSANNLILWKALGKLRKAGVRELDLGGLNTQDVPGIARFKLGTGAEVKTLCGTWFGR